LTPRGAAIDENGLAAAWNGPGRRPISSGRSRSREHPVQETVLATLLQAPLACCRWELERRHMTPPSNFALRIVVEENAGLVRALNCHYADAAPDGGLDVAERDLLFDVLGVHFTGREWPRSGGMEVTKRFVIDLQAEMIAKNWKVDLLAVA
jgi:hypothetical protein